MSVIFTATDTCTRSTGTPGARPRARAGRWPPRLSAAAAAHSKRRYRTPRWADSTRHTRNRNLPDLPGKGHEEGIAGTRRKVTSIHSRTFGESRPPREGESRRRGSPSGSRSRRDSARHEARTSTSARAAFVGRGGSTSTRRGATTMTTRRWRNRAGARSRGRRSFTRAAGHFAALGWVRARARPPSSGTTRRGRPRTVDEGTTHGEHARGGHAYAHANHGVSKVRGEDETAGCAGRHLAELAARREAARRAPTPRPRRRRRGGR